MTRQARQARKLFWTKVPVGGPDECWEWQGQRDKDGYGRFGNGSVGSVGAHRRMWLYIHGDDPGDLCVLHTCDNPPCVNPAHLWLGTEADNTADMVTKGRALPAERTYANKLTEEQAREIRGLFGQGWVQQDIADAYGIHQSTVRRIGRGETWKRLVTA